MSSKVLSLKKIFFLKMNNKILCMVLGLIIFQVVLWMSVVSAQDNTWVNKDNMNDSILTQEKKDDVEQPKKPVMKFGSINRLQFRYALNGESAFSQGTFILLPYGLNFAELFETFTKIDDKSTLEFNNFSLEMKLARYLVPSNEWGRMFSLIGRFQAANETTSVKSAGLQWNISETPGIKQSTLFVPWKNIFQVFIKEETDYSDGKRGTVDLFHWYQFPLITDRLDIRGINSYYYIPNQRNYYYLMQDLILSITDKLEIYVRHSYQNIEFFSHKKGSQFALGIRIAH